MTFSPRVAARLERRRQLHETIRTIAPPLLDVGRVGLQGLFNVLTSLTQAMASSPIAASAGTIVIADMLQKFKVITPGGSALAISVVTGLSAAKVAGAIIEDILPDLPFTQADQSTPTTINLVFDVPDFPGAPAPMLALPAGR